jgi:hypothetical protein
MLGARAATWSSSYGVSAPTVTSSTMAPAPSDASRAARAVMLAVRPCTVIRRPPAAELLTCVSRSARAAGSRPWQAARSARAASTPTPTSPKAAPQGSTPPVCSGAPASGRVTVVGAKPRATCRSSPSTQANALTFVMVLPTSTVTTLGGAVRGAGGGDGSLIRGPPPRPVARPASATS